MPSMKAVCAAKLRRRRRRRVAVGAAVREFWRGRRVGLTRGGRGDYAGAGRGEVEVLNCFSRGDEGSTGRAPVPHERCEGDEAAAHGEVDGHVEERLRGRAPHAGPRRRRAEAALADPLVDGVVPALGEVDAEQQEPGRVGHPPGHVGEYRQSQEIRRARQREHAGPRSIHCVRVPAHAPGEEDGREVDEGDGGLEAVVEDECVAEGEDTPAEGTVAEREHYRESSAAVDLRL